MTNHVHLIIGRAGEFKIEEILRDFKKFTSSQIIKAIIGNPPESRREWMLNIFKNAGHNNSKHKDYQFWQQNNKPIELNNKDLMNRALNYLHNNPVVAGIVEEPWEYLYNSARDYSTERKGLLPLVFAYDF